MKNYVWMARVASMLVVASLWLTACQDEKVAPVEKAADEVTTALRSADKVSYLVSHFFTPMDDAAIEKMYAAYVELSPEEMEELIELDNSRRLENNEDVQQVTALRDYRKMMHTESIGRFGKSFNAVDKAAQDELFSVVPLPEIAQQAPIIKTEIEEPALQASCSNWVYTTSIGFRSTGTVQWNGCTFLYEARFCRNSTANCDTDCDMVFRSRNYNRYYYSSHLHWKNLAARAVMTFSRNFLFSGTSLPCRRVTTGTNEEILYFGVGKSRLQSVYGFGSGYQQTFANDVIVQLNKR